MPDGQRPDAGGGFIGFLSGRKGIAVTLTALSLILAVFLVQTFGRAYRDGGYDFTSYLLSSQALFQGANPYETGSPFPFIYPLFLCAVVYPLAVLPYWLSNLIWFLTGAAALFCSAWLLLGMRRDPLPAGAKITAILIAFLLLLDVVQNNLLNGQANLPVLLLCTLFIEYDGRRRPIISSAALAAAIAIKLTPIIFIPYLIVRGNFRGALLTAVLSIVFTVGVPLAVAGPATLEWTSRYVSAIIGGTMPVAAEAGGASFSLTSLLRSIVPGVPAGWAFPLAGIVAFVPLIGIQLARRAADPSTGVARIFALYLLTILLLGPMSETHHLILLLPAALPLAAVVVTGSPSGRVPGITLLVISLAALILGRYWFPANFAAIIALYAGMIRIPS